PHSLSSSEAGTLRSYQRQLPYWAKIIHDQIHSHAGQSPLFKDKLYYLTKTITELNQNIHDSLNQQGITSSHFSEMHNQMERMQEIVHELAGYNKILRAIQRKENRKAHHQSHAGKQYVSLVHYNIITHEIKQEFKELEDIPLEARYCQELAASQQPTCCNQTFSWVERVQAQDLNHITNAQPRSRSIN
ncbi:MAG: hypothetical protein ACK4M7_06410, partial [Burkholderiales bacterium]